MRIFHPAVVGFLACAAALFGNASSIYATEAIRGKQYGLTKQHGPWMIMVATLRDTPKDRREAGLSAAEAAAELVFELRKMGIPAYTFSQDSEVKELSVSDRTGKSSSRLYAAQRDMVCILAGNYPAIDDPVAQKTLAKIKKTYPQFLKEKKSGGVFSEKGPLAGAFLTINPLLSPEDIAGIDRDPEILELNSGIDNSLLEAKPKYTIRIATFAGKSSAPTAGSPTKKDSAFDANLGKGYNLNVAGEDAAQLARALRAQKVDAYVYHDRYQSIVTVGKFSDRKDPRIAALAQQFAGRWKKDQETGDEVFSGQAVTVPGKKPTDPPQFVWGLDTTPFLMELKGVKVVAAPMLEDTPVASSDKPVGGNK